MIRKFAWALMIVSFSLNSCSSDSERIAELEKELAELTESDSNNELTKDEYDPLDSKRCESINAIDYYKLTDSGGIGMEYSEGGMIVYKDGELYTGQTKLCQFNGNGNIFLYGNRVDGYPEGRQYSYYESGQLKSFTTQKRGINHGDWIEFDEKGVIKMKKVYENGRLISCSGDCGWFEEQELKMDQNN